MKKSNAVFTKLHVVFKKSNRKKETCKKNIFFKRTLAVDGERWGGDALGYLIDTKKELEEKLSKGNLSYMGTIFIQSAIIAKNSLTKRDCFVNIIG